MSFVTPITDWVAGDPVLYTDMNRIEGNTEALWNPPSGSSGFLDVANYTVNSATFANVDGTNLAVEITITGDTVLFLFNFSTGGARVSYYDIHNGTSRIGGDDGLFKVTGTQGVPGAIRLTGLSPGTYTFTLQWKNDGGGTTTLFGGNGSAGDQVHPRFDVVEIG